MRSVALRLAAAVGLLWSSLAAADAPVAPNHVREVRVHAVDGVPEGTEIEIVGTSTPTYNVRLADGGRRLLIDLGNADVAGAPEAITSRVGVVGGVMTQAFQTPGGKIARVSIGLTKGATYRVRTEGTSLRVILSPEGAQAHATPGSMPGASSTESGTSATASTSEHAKAAIRDVKFERAGGNDRVVVALSAVPAYVLTTNGEGKPRLEMKATELPEALERALDVSAYKGPLRTISTFSDPARGLTIVEVDLPDGARGSVAVEGASLVWSFPTPKGAPDASTVTPPPPVHRGKTVAREFDPNANMPQVQTSMLDSSTEETAGGGEAGFAAHINAQQVRRGGYTGRRIDIDLKDADIHNILRFLADVGHVNIVAADDVSGTITIRMRNVPWDQALDVVLQAKGLGMVRQGNLIRVAPAAVLQKERELEAAKRKSEYEATPLETRLIPINYAQAEDMVPRAKDMLSPRGTLAVDDRTNTLIVRDIPGMIDNIENLVHTLDTQTSQVLVEARIVEATSKYLRDVGIQWGGDATFSEATGNPTGVAFPSRVTAVGGNYDNQTPTAGLSPFTRQVPTPNFAVNLPAAVGTGQGGALGLSFGSIDNTLNLGVRLSAAESSGLLRVVSSPRIMVLNNQEARINQGTLIPFAQISALGVQTTFQEAKLQLLVRPHVTADGSVAMHVKISRDEPDFNQTSPRGDPTILKREAETDLLVMDGHTAVIGGIYTRNTGRNLDQVPFFGDIPILGVLFQRRRASDTRNELVIFLTPRIVNRDASMGR